MRSRRRPRLRSRGGGGGGGAGSGDEVSEWRHRGRLRRRPLRAGGAHTLLQPTRRPVPGAR
eukprot:1515898-Lingulodinium_polyedra.AAC.1